MFLRTARPRRQNKMRVMKQLFFRVLYTRGLFARHGMTADEIHCVRQALCRFHDRPLNTAHISDKRTGLERIPESLNLLCNTMRPHGK